MATTAPLQVATVGEGAILTGKVRGKSLTVLGRVEGELQLEGRLQVGAGGRVAGKVRAGEVVVEGEIDGEVSASALTLSETARARGTFVAKRLVVKEGAVVEGTFNPVTAAPEAKASDEKKPVGADKAPGADDKAGKKDESGAGRLADEGE
jgi:cytoskeletal protein CcmA (bactofilin family)